ncbi:MAG: carbamoyltransferase [Candidatus Pacebacteria bacterium]|jgi:carbamoyltransferase|nr:carbamoyltransferase [Candidatus Paceibacterota bacterium]MBT4004730.1 carbamoyltransferase [Candidatus Paceibacterota bacterium]MBT6899279.1 carbamoyltransferase [Candidatus Paceibacterota bacterium]MBT7184179.1 carbamoyltransferase [Candidatus Paceibacterota bacterium]MBT7309989.1 carbamoyltransferase [Candidatus Paceibacterota bacterium]
MKILGLSCFYHDSAACLISDGEIIAAGAEERFSRKKHDNGFPKLAIDYCLKEAGLAINELDSVVFYEKPIWKFDRIIHQHLEHFPKSYQAFVDTSASWLNQKLNIKKILKDEIHYHGQITFLPHHLSHSASAYYLSPFQKATIVTIDGVGEWATTTVGMGQKDKIQVDQEIRFPHSLGLLYSTLTAYLGFKVNNDEYKVMGLAAYGDPKPYQEYFDKLITLHTDGSYTLNMDYFDYTWSQHMPSKKMAELFEHPIRKPESKIYKYHQNIAAALQQKLEEAIFNLLTQTHRKYKTDNLCLAGGVALNSVMNAKILSHTPFKNLYIPPDPSDAGAAMGAALYLDRNPKLINSKSKTAKTHLKIAKSFNPYLGPGYTSFQIEQVLDEAGLKYRFYKDEQKLLDRTSNLLIKKQVIGWYQGRMEWGPRALGNRSILAAATSRDMQDILNAKVKKREMFRPFAPVILKEYMEQYFETDKPVPEIADYMLLVYPFTKKGRENIPATTHVDGTGRPQRISRKDNQLYYDLIDNYRQKTGIPVIINTSFNIRGEPIVCTPEDAARCFLGTKIDYLVIDGFVVKK